MKIKFDKMYREGYIIVKYNRKYVLKHINVESYVTKSWSLDAFYIVKNKKVYMVTLTDFMCWNNYPDRCKAYQLGKTYKGSFIGWYADFNQALSAFTKLKGDNK